MLESKVKLDSFDVLVVSESLSADCLPPSINDGKTKVWLLRSLGFTLRPHSAARCIIDCGCRYYCSRVTQTEGYKNKCFRRKREKKLSGAEKPSERENAWRISKCRGLNGPLKPISTVDDPHVNLFLGHPFRFRGGECPA